MHQASLGRSRRFDSRAGMEVSDLNLSTLNIHECFFYLQSHTDTHSVLSGGSKTSKFFTKEQIERKITLRVRKSRSSWSFF